MRQIISLCLLVSVVAAAAAGLVAATVKDPPRGPDGAIAKCDIPLEWHLRNKGGSEGSGLCVFTSIDHAARWQGVDSLVGFRDWMTRYPGGGWPQKVDQMIAKICKDRGVAKPRYLQVEGRDLEILRTAIQSGRMPGVTYGYSPSGRYNRKRISHMVSLVHADEKSWAILDNNYPGNYEWMSNKEFLAAYTDTGGSGWAVILLDPGPPPSPYNVIGGGK